MNCSHKNTVKYTLTNEDKKDFSQRLEDFLGSGNHEKLAMTFLTPTNSIRGHRAKSMLTTTMTTSVREGTTSLSKLLETDTDEFPSGEKRRSSGHCLKKRSSLVPSQLFNCSNCGAIYFHVSICLFVFFYSNYSN